jgi:UDP-glucose 4-epimerase
LGDIAKSVRLRTVLEQHRPAALMHFAAYAYVGESVEDPLLLSEQRGCIGCTTSDAFGDPAVLIGAFDRAQATPAWEPARSDLEIQIRDAWNWMRGAVRPAKTQ